MSIFYKNIGLDLDGVLTEHDKFQLEKGLIYFCKKYKKIPSEVIKDIHGYDVTEIFGCSEYERFFFWGRYIWEYCSIHPPRLGASEVTEKWMNEGRNITIITGRKEAREFCFVSLFLTLLTRYWLYRQKIFLFLCPGHNRFAPFGFGLSMPARRSEYVYRKSEILRSGIILQN